MEIPKLHNVSSEEAKILQKYLQGDKVFAGIQLSLIFQKRGYANESLILLEEISKDNPQVAKAKSLLAQGYFIKGLWELSEEYAKEALNLDSQDWGSHKILVKIYLLQKKNQDAENHIKIFRFLSLSDMMMDSIFGHIKQKQYSQARQIVVRELQSLGLIYDEVPNLKPTLMIPWAQLHRKKETHNKKLTLLYKLLQKIHDRT